MKLLDRQLRAFAEMIEGQSMRPSDCVRFGFDALFDPARLFVNYLPGGAGMLLRRLVYSWRLKQLGRNVLIDVGVSVTGAGNISIGDYTWIDSGVTLTSAIGTMTIGKRVHIAPGAILASSCRLEVHDYVGIAAGAKIYAGSEVPKDGKRMSGPMIPERFKAFRRDPVILQKDSFLGANAVVLPGVTVGEGAVVGANSLVTKDVAPWTIVMGSPAKEIRRRAPVTVPEL